MPQIIPTTRVQYHLADPDTDVPPDIEMKEYRSKTYNLSCFVGHYEDEGVIHVYWRGAAFLVPLALHEQGVET